MADVTYDWYKDNYKGNAIQDAETFAGIITEATAYIKQITRGKATGETEAEKNATCAVAEVIYKQSQDDTATVSSESVGNHSKSYTKQTRSSAEREAEKARKARLYLSGTGLLYGGLK